MAQISKHYSGSIKNLGSTRSRVYSYGTTFSISSYDSHTDLINSTIASFLTECGVPAAYEVRSGSTEKFLWIHNVPFLIIQNYNSNLHYIAQPYVYSTSCIDMSPSTLLFFTSYNSTTYDFTLYFAGHPTNGFILRIQHNTNMTTPSQFKLGVAKCTNILNNKTGIVWFYGSGTNNLSGGYYQGIDLNSNNIMDQNSLYNQSVSHSLYNYYQAALSSNPQSYSTTPTKIPLVPIQFGVYRATGIYQTPVGFSLPKPNGYSSSTLTELEFSNRKFILTQPGDGPSSNYWNLGLIEVTDAP